MNELQFPVLYIDDTANPHAILSFLCQSGYYCLILTDFLAEFETKCGRVYCDNTSTGVLGFPAGIRNKVWSGVLRLLRRNTHQLSSRYRLCGNSRTLPMDGCVSP